MSEETRKHKKPRIELIHKPPLHWRNDPTESKTDWTIEILVNGEIHGSYPVHTSVLCEESKRSEYFAGLFVRQHSEFSENQSRSSRIELPPLAAEAFPFFLDYFYLKSGSLEDIDYEHAAALFYLGDYFGVVGIQHAAEKVWRQHMKIENCAVFYEHSQLFSNEKLAEAVDQLLCHDVGAIDPLRANFAGASISSWLHVLTTALETNNGRPNDNLVALISKFCYKRKDDLSFEAFLMLTDLEVLPTMGYKAALSFLEFDKLFCGSSSLSSGELSDLQARCIDELAASKDVSVETKNFVLTNLENIDPRLVDIYSRRSIELALFSSDNDDDENQDEDDNE